MGYCTVADLYLYGLPRGALSNPGRLAASASASTNTIALDQHGFVTGDEITLRAEGGGSLPAPLVAGAAYFVVAVGESAFSVAATPAGAVIDLTTPGARIVVTIKVSREAAIEFGTALINDKIPGHALPLTVPYPPLVVMTCAELAVGKLLSITGSGSKSLGEVVDAAMKRLDRWATGVPVRGANPQASANAAVSATAPALDSRGWSRWGAL